VSRLVDEAVVAYGRWRAQHPEFAVPPLVKVSLVGRGNWYFNGLAVAPSLESPHVAVVSSVGIGGLTLVVRDDDIFLIEIQAPGE